MKMAIFHEIVVVIESLLSKIADSEQVDQNEDQDEYAEEVKEVVRGILEQFQEESQDGVDLDLEIYETPNSNEEQNFELSQPEQQFEQSQPEQQFEQSQPEQQFEQSQPEQQFEQSQPEQQFEHKGTQATYNDDYLIRIQNDTKILLENSEKILSRLENLPSNLFEREQYPLYDKMETRFKASIAVASSRYDVQLSDQENITQYHEDVDFDGYAYQPNFKKRNIDSVDKENRIDADVIPIKRPKIRIGLSRTKIRRDPMYN